MSSDMLYEMRRHFWGMTRLDLRYPKVKVLEDHMAK